MAAANTTKEAIEYARRHRQLPPALGAARDRRSRNKTSRRFSIRNPRVTTIGVVLSFPHVEEYKARIETAHPLVGLEVRGKKGFDLPSGALT
jgi:hypothetical protein